MTQHPYLDPTYPGSHPNSPSLFLAQHERIRAQCFHPEGPFVPLAENELDHSLLPRFTEMVERFPDHPAVREGGRTLTYRQLDAAANRVANALLAKCGLQPCAIALLFGMELEWIVATLGVWKAGHFWVALDLRHPQTRLNAILDDAQAALILTTARHHELAGTLTNTPISSERQWLTVEDALANFPDAEPQIEIGPENFAYLVYTSGSTGRPKGVIENHTNILHMIAERGNLVHPSSADKIALLLPPAAGGAIYNIVLALWYGATLKLFEFSAEGVARFEEWLAVEEITGMHAGVVLRTWLPTLDGSRRFPLLRFLILGAAPVYREHVIAFQRFVGGNCVLINPYSSAEVRAISLFAMDAATTLTTSIVPVGYPPPWVTVEIWGDEGKPLPCGVTGEVVVFTRYMTPGYWQQPELTASVFGVDAAGRRYYRSGDVGRLDGDGCLWILGRKDRQVKIRGHRVEPAEVEVALLDVPGVREVAVVAHGTRDDDNYLAAHVTLLPACKLSAAELRKSMAARLPSYMVPRQVTVLAQLPRNGYGKVDRPLLAASPMPGSANFLGYTVDSIIGGDIKEQTERQMSNNQLERAVRHTEIPHAEEVYAERVAMGKRIYAPKDVTGDATGDVTRDVTGGKSIPFSPEEQEQTLLHRWERMVAFYAERPALEDGERTLSYAETNALANRIAHAILAHTLPADVPVALLFEIEGDMAVAAIATWKAGKFYTWLEPRQPLARNHFVVEESGAQAVITNRKHKNVARQLWPEADAVIVIEELAEALPTSNPPLNVDPGQPAYLLYTSGSTGTPKGTLDLHRNVVHFLVARESLFHFTPEDRTALLLYGAGHLVPFAAAWMYGGCLLPFNFKEEGLARFSQWLNERRITYISGGAETRTWLLSLDGSEQFPHLRLVSLSTGPTYREHLLAYQRYLPDHCLLVNLLSATEFRVSTIFLMDKQTQLDNRVLPAGYATSPTTIELWDETGSKAGAGQAGEIVIVSPYVAPGYWKSPELSARKFGVDSQGRRFFRTGDAGRFDEQGCLWVLGRADQQVKIRGNRIESAEVEAALRELPGVREAAVMAQGESEMERRLVGFVAAEAGTNGAALRQQLMQRLPDYMIPASIVVYDELPRNANGKVDRTVLHARPATHNDAEAGMVESANRMVDTSSTLSTASTSPTSSEVATLSTNGARVEMNGDFRAHQTEVAARAYHPTGEYLPITLAEAALSPLHRWEQIVARYGDNLALEEDERTLTYRQINAEMNRLAHAILAHNVPKAIPVAILYDVEGDLPLSIFAIWKAGNFFVWLEPSQPQARHQLLLEDSGAPLIVTNRKHAGLARQLLPAEQVLVVEDLVVDLAVTLPTQNPPITIRADDPAYLLYTSGSTGRPKGVLDSHRNLMMMMVVRQEVLHFSSHDRVNLLVLASGWSFATLGAFLYGGSLLPFCAKEEGLARFSRWLIERRITITVGGSVLRSWLLTLDGSLHFPDLRAFTVGAGPTYIEHLQAFQRYLADGCVMVSTYSATEARSMAMQGFGKHVRLASRLLPAGHATLHEAIEIWDEDGRPLPTGESGEIVAITPYAALGYWKSPELTASKFGEDAQGRRFYRSGDLGRLDDNGCLWVLGRKDGQVKIRGHRVETAEIEVALLELPHVQEAAVIHIGEDESERTLLAFVASPAALKGSDLRQQLATRLPDYMLPTAVIVLEELPRNTNGKVARPLLRDMAAAFATAGLDKRGRNQSEDHSSFRTATEARVAGMVSELLRGVKVGAHDNFFDVGGHSLLAARLMLEIHRAYGVDLAPRDFFENPTIAALAASVDRLLEARTGERTGAKATGKENSKETRAMSIEAVPVLTGAADALPVFLCLGWNGSQGVLMRYQELYRRLGKRWPLYGLVASGCRNPRDLYTTMGQLVEATLSAIRQVQPRGPYLLMGECLGGKLAYETARKLAGEGKQIAMLLLLDAPLRSPATTLPTKGQLLSKTTRQAVIWRGRFRHHRQQLAALGWQEQAHYVAERLAALLPHALYPQSPYRPRLLAQQRYVELLRHFVPVEAYPHPATALFTSQFHAHREAWATLLPQGEITVIEGQHRDYLMTGGDEVAALVKRVVDEAGRNSALR